MRKISRVQLFELLKNRTMYFDTGTAFLEVDEFKIQPLENTADIYGIGSNDDHYIGTANIHAREIDRLIGKE